MCGWYAVDDVDGANWEPTNPMKAPGEEAVQRQEREKEKTKEMTKGKEGETKPKFGGIQNTTAPSPSKKVTKFPFFPPFDDCIVYNEKKPTHHPTTTTHIRTVRNPRTLPTPLYIFIIFPPSSLVADTMAPVIYVIMEILYPMR